MHTKTLWIRDEYLTRILAGRKTVEVRVGYANITRLQPGDRLLLNDRHPYWIRRVGRYPDFEALLAAEDPSSIAPELSSSELLGALRAIYPPEKEALGALALELEPERRLLSLTDPDTPAGRAARVIYDEAFAPDERVPWDRLWEWHRLPSHDFQSIFWLLLAPVELDTDGESEQGAQEVVGLLLFGHFPGPNLGYLMYLAIRPDQRGRGHGEWLFAQGVAEIERIARREQSVLPRASFWEVRSPDDAPAPDERTRRDRRMRFYQRLGGRALPLDYTCPPLADGQPPVRFTVMVYTYLPGATIDRALASEIALTGLIEANGAEPGDRYVEAALASVERHWPRPSAKQAFPTSETRV